MTLLLHSQGWDLNAIESYRRDQEALQTDCITNTTDCIDVTTSCSTIVLVEEIIFAVYLTQQIKWCSYQLKQSPNCQFHSQKYRS